MLGKKFLLSRETLEENTMALEQEKNLNVELLYSMFPSDIAKILLTGKNIQARKVKVNENCLIIMIPA